MKKKKTEKKNREKLCSIITKVYIVMHCIYGFFVVIRNYIYICIRRLSINHTFAYAYAYACIEENGSR